MRKAQSTVRTPKASTSPQPKIYPLGSVFNPHTVPQDYLVRFAYDETNWFECALRKDGTLQVRCTGTHSDVLATHHHVANDISIVARRWSSEQMRRADFIPQPKEASRG